jgi:hypothetical protein
MEWIKALHNEAHDLWQRAGANPDGYAIFYSPVTTNPPLLIIGYNPGGDTQSFKEPPTAPPQQHDYIVDNYSMAKRIRYIFEAAGILNILEKSVKTNLYYFRSKSAATLKELDEERKNFCLSWTKQIIDHLKPTVILAEGFKTFSELIRLLKVKQISQENMDDKAVMLFSEYNGIKLIGIPHPTGARGYKNEHWRTIGPLIRDVTLGR